MAKSTAEKFQDYVVKLEGLFHGAQSAIADLEHERDCLKVQQSAEPFQYPEGATPLTDESLLAAGLKWHDKNGSYNASFGRLTFWVRSCGTWGIHFDSTYGGSIGSYRKLQSVQEVLALLALLGIDPTERS